jgi:hypothetical protein
MRWRSFLIFCVTAAATLPIAAQKPSELVQPALNKVAQAGSNVDLNKWKGGNALRGEVDANLSSVQKDLQNTLPPLLTASDNAPASVPATMRVLLNLDALYSVLLRIQIAGKADAPRDQSDALESALAALDGARRDLGDRITTSSAALEKQIATLQATVQQQTAQIAAAQQAAAAAAATPPPPPKTTKKKVAKRKPAAPKPTTATPATPTPAPAK